MVRTHTYFGPDRPVTARHVPLPRAVSALHHTTNANTANDNTPRRAGRAVVRRRELVCRWRFDAASGRLVCRWELADDDAQSGDVPDQPRCAA